MSIAGIVDYEASFKFHRCTRNLDKVAFSRQVNTGISWLELSRVLLLIDQATSLIDQPRLNGWIPWRQLPDSRL